MLQTVCAVMFSLFLPRCAAREQDLRNHPLYYGADNEERFKRAATAFNEVVRVCTKAFAGP